MKVHVPNQINAFGLVTKVAILLALGYGAFTMTGSIWLGALSFIVLLVAIPVIKRYSINRQFSKYLKGFGEEFTKEYSQEIFDASIMGFIPFNEQNMHCSIFADESGIMVSKRSTKRHIPWSSIVGHKNKEYLGHPVLELNLINYENSNRLAIPWAEKFSKYLP